MNPILSGTEAFEAMSAGQKIEARHAGSDLDFDEICNFPATVFIDQDYEFRIAVVYMTIGLMQVPEAIKEAPAKGTLCFAPSLLTTELSKSFKWKNSESDLELLVRGLVHLYEENAMTHARALISISHGSLIKNEESNSDDEMPWSDQNDQNSTSNDVEDSLTDFDQPKAEPASENLSVDELKRLQEEAEKSVAEKKLAETAEIEYQKLLSELLDGVAKANTPAEVNAHTRYTKPWSEQQRKPLLDAIHKRLQELAPAVAEIKMPPSLMVQIQNAKDLAELDCLEIEVSTRHVDIQSKLMGYVKQRRFELENQADGAGQ